ncbi:hypothetical protein CV_0371 [Chromobacterium violaceum ATCC 12472]|uniref:Uncharacterized protein n=1 Tax=Chromobacterium violaceum (strain ATCC 12472 / DSM 30191 / JCM 1249 / CCUG 213 / NBRC 12614 / NCIMB 9131 / NCTC 9757 / MK) TaxID=243365 RepID=Q7P143_CHRVO|nr:hypothetical protein CV_0371 [Chromobacterium violaceum ATCC 12472]
MVQRPAAQPAADMRRQPCGQRHRRQHRVGAGQLHQHQHRQHRRARGGGQEGRHAHQRRAPRRQPARQQHVQHLPGQRAAGRAGEQHGREDAPDGARAAGGGGGHKLARQQRQHQLPGRIADQQPRNRAIAIAPHLRPEPGQPPDHRAAQRHPPRQPQRQSAHRPAAQLHRAHEQRRSDAQQQRQQAIAGQGQMVGRRQRRGLIQGSKTEQAIDGEAGGQRRQQQGRQRAPIQTAPHHLADEGDGRQRRMVGGCPAGGDAAGHQQAAARQAQRRQPGQQRAAQRGQRHHRALAADGAAAGDGGKRRQAVDQGAAQAEPAVADAHRLQVVAFGGAAQQMPALLQNQAGQQAAQHRRQRALPGRQLARDCHQAAAASAQALLDRMQCELKAQHQQRAQRAAAGRQRQIQDKGMAPPPRLHRLTASRGRRPAPACSRPPAASRNK